MEPSRPKEQTTYNYPFAAAPDIIRSHQKDVYFEGILLNHLSTLLRRFYGARFIHTYTNEAQTFSELLYLSLTTLLGNRTLGEEYCDIIQVEDDTLSLPSIGRRAGYIVTAILLPYSLNKVLPSFRSRIRAKLESNLGRLSRIKQQKSWVYKFQNYLLEHLSTITSPSPLHALTITIFYFSGAYYQLSKRVFGLRYIFTKKVGESEARVGYEVLGVLLVVQIAVQTWLHVHSTLANASIANQNEIVGGTAMIDGGVEVSLDPNSYSSNQELLLDNPIAPSSAGIAKRTNTKILPGPRYDLREAEDVLGYIQGQNRKCTLCLEGLKDPSAPPCGHIFCWECIRDWVMEKPECPLCRREALAKQILPLRI